MISVGVTGGEAPPVADRLARLLAANLGSAVDVDVVYVLLAHGSAAAP